jgi:hypothetical protein
MNRPTNVTIAAGLQFFHSGIGILVTLALLLIQPFRNEMIIKPIQLQPQNPPISGDILLPVIIGAIGFSLLFNVIELLLGSGLLKCKRWAWICTLALHIIIALSNLVGLLTIPLIPSLPAPGLDIYRQIFQVILSGGIVYYLLRQDVKQSFAR